ncbi:tryptophanyl-tRNA synthetase [Dactylonectria macrodidyma]|uniref:Tryptophan--tRNA ligase, cytoplasmic n=1 Tax=Dactylonectria macrodidyma TaxID=307937 RepID=A0A9P9IEY7_9HYPO|nr:tryptophanyl-tRNA synthetase [Dactylonectria macrodidyma]
MATVETAQDLEPSPPNVIKQNVNPWSVTGNLGQDGKVKAIDYRKLVDDFGTKPIDDALLERFEKVTGHKPHRFLRRQIVVSHRDFTLILDRYERNEPFFLYTGRGPSSDSMHVGHGVVFDFVRWLQDIFDVPLVIMLTDDEKFLFSPKRTVAESIAYSNANAKDIIALGFDARKTFIFSDFEYIGGAFYRNIIRFSKRVTYNTAKAVFGFDDDSNIGKIFFPSIQGAAAFASSYPHIFGKDESITAGIPCLIPCAIDQDPYFRLTRNCAAGLHIAKPCSIYMRFLDALQGPGSKMSASDDKSAIFLNDTPKKVETKIKKYAFSGGKESVEEHREKGGDPGVDVSYQYLEFFMESDEDLKRIKEEYSSGKLLTGELKSICIDHVQQYVQAFQQRRASVTDETVKGFMTPRALQWQGNPKVPRSDVTVPVGEGVQNTPESEEPGKLSKNQMKKLLKEQQIVEKKAKKTGKTEKAEEKPAAQPEGS